MSLFPSWSINLPDRTGSYTFKIQRMVDICAMPQLLDRIPIDGCRYLIWHIDETEDWFLKKMPLSESNQERLSKLMGRRRKEWLTGRYTLYQLIDEQEGITCEVDDNGKPYLEGVTANVSISHSFDHVAAIMGLVPVGIDIQKISDRIRRIKHKFVSDREMSSIDETDEIMKLHVIWGAKECLFKAYGRGEVDFRKHLHIDPFKAKFPGHTTGRFHKNEELMEFDLFYDLIGDYVLVYALGE